MDTALANSFLTCREDRATLGMVVTRYSILAAGHSIVPKVFVKFQGKRDCWDNVYVETFFKTIKKEMETLEGRHFVAGVRQSVFMHLFKTKVLKNL
jgi:hypothetical protein